MRKRVVHVNLRLPPELHEQLAEWARGEHRSIHSQVLHVLTEALDKEKKRRARQQQAESSK